MVRRAYRYLVQVHPRAFYERYGAEMMGIYDNVTGARNRAWLFADVLASLLRQHFLREPAASPTPVAAGGAPLFTALDDSRPSFWALSNGGAATVVVWLALILVMTAGAQRRTRPAAVPHIRSGVSLPQLLPQLWSRPAAPRHPLMIQLDTDGDGRLSPTEIARVGQRLATLDGEARTMFDLNGDGVLSDSEIAAAPAVLRTLDRDADGFVTQSELTP